MAKSDSNQLTAREREVLKLWVEGHSSTVIAERLSIVPATVNRHIANIYQKLELKGKADVIRFVYDHSSDYSDIIHFPQQRVTSHSETSNIQVKRIIDPGDPDLLAAIDLHQASLPAEELDPPDILVRSLQDNLKNQKK